MDKIPHMNAQSRLDETGAGHKEMSVENQVRSWRLFLQTSALFPEKESFENPVLSRALPTKTHTHTHVCTHTAALWPQMLMPPLREPQDSCRLDLFIVGQTMDATS